MLYFTTEFPYHTYRYIVNLQKLIYKTFILKIPLRFFIYNFSIFSITMFFHYSSTNLTRVSLTFCDLTFRIRLMILNSDDFHVIKHSYVHITVSAETNLTR